MLRHRRHDRLSVDLPDCFAVPSESRILSSMKLMRLSEQMVAKYPNARVILVEDAANGHAVVDALKKKVRGILAVTPEGGKLSRAAAVQPQIEAGQVLCRDRGSRTASFGSSMRGSRILSSRAISSPKGNMMTTLTH